MRTVTFHILVILILMACKPTKKSIDIVHVNEQTQEIEDSLNRDYLQGKIINQRNEPIELAAIKLVINDSTCLNAYSNFDGEFGSYYNSSLITKNSYFEIVYKGYQRRIIPFLQFNNEVPITLQKKGKVVTDKEYLQFYEEIRSCRW